MDKVLAALVIFAIVAGFALLFGFPIMWLWNWIVVPMGLPSLTFWKAVGLALLIHMLFPSSSGTSS